jgi:hypothetical protein
VTIQPWERIHPLLPPVKKFKPSETPQPLSQEFNLGELPLLFLDQLCIVMPISYYKSLARVNKSFYDVFRRWLDKRKNILLDEMGIGLYTERVNPFVLGFKLDQTELQCEHFDILSGSKTSLEPLEMSFKVLKKKYRSAESIRRTMIIRKCKYCRVWPKWVKSKNHSVSNGSCPKCLINCKDSDTYKKCNGERPKDSMIYYRESGIIKKSNGETCEQRIYNSDKKCDYCMKIYCMDCRNKYLDHYWHKKNLRGHEIISGKSKTFCNQCIKIKNTNNMWIKVTRLPGNKLM